MSGASRRRVGDWGWRIVVSCLHLKAAIGTVATAAVAAEAAFAKEVFGEDEQAVLEVVVSAFQRGRHRARLQTREGEGAQID